jgi:hypothetical protein
MSEKDNSVPPLSFFEMERQASIRRNLVVQACMRAAVRASAKWLRLLVLRSTRLARGLGAKRRRRGAIRELQQLDDRTLADKRRGSLLSTVTFRLWAAASICFATGGATAAENATVLPPICAAADVRIVMLIEAHGEAQDVAPEILAQAFFTVIEARKACNQGQIEAAIKLYESIPLHAVISHGQ